MTVLDDLLRHQAAWQVLRNPDSTQEQRDEARTVLGLPPANVAGARESDETVGS